MWKSYHISCRHCMTMTCESLVVRKRQVIIRDISHPLVHRSLPDSKGPHLSERTRLADHSCLQILHCSWTNCETNASERQCVGMLHFIICRALGLYVVYMSVIVYCCGYCSWCNCYMTHDEDLQGLINIYLSRHDGCLKTKTKSKTALHEWDCILKMGQMTMCTAINAIHSYEN